MAKSRELRNRINELRAQLETSKARFLNASASLLAWEKPFEIYHSSFRENVDMDIRESLAKMAQLSEAMPLGLRPRITDDALSAWVPGEADQLPASLPFGHYYSEILRESTFPASIPFIGTCRPIVFGCDASSAAVCREVLLSMLLRTVLYLPQRARYFLIDPANSGNAFISFAGALAHRGDSTGDICMDLKRIQEGFQRIQTNFLNPRADSFEKLDAATQASEKLQLVFVADYPKRFDRRAAEMLHTIATNGPQNGTYVFVEWNVDHSPPPGMQFDELQFSPGTTIDLRKGKIDEGGNGFSFSTDQLPDPENVKLALDKAREMERQDVGVISFSDERILPAKEQWWSRSAADYIETSIGLRGAHDTIDLWFGARQQTTCSHGIVAGTTGSGKSVFLHVLICGLAARYSPQELNLYIIDMKDGVELSCYHKLPHTSVISSNSSPELARSILRELCDELTRRYELFRLSGGSQNLSDYRKARGVVLPRVLLIIDEYQGIFINDREGDASQLLRQIAEKGRAAGIHLLLASQKFEAAGMEQADAIFNNFSLRLALRLESDQVDRQQMFGTAAERSLLRQCDVAGKIVVRSPELSDCITGRVAMLDTKTRNHFLEELSNKRTEANAPVPCSIVLDGMAEPSFSDSPFIRELVADPSISLASKQLASLVKRNEIGLGVRGWLAEDDPMALVVGKDFTVRGFASFVMRRKSGDNVLIVSAEHECERFGILVAIASSAVLQRRDSLQLEILDFAQPQTRWHGCVEEAGRLLARKFSFSANYTTDRRLAEDAISRLSEELDRRKTLDDEALAQEKTVLIILAEPDRVQNLHRQGVGLAASDSPAGLKLRKLYHEGPLLGIHVVIAAGSAANLWQIMDRRAVDIFRYRICLQIDEKSSYDLLGSAKASSLNRVDPRPVRALLYDQQRSSETIFKPYVCHGKDAGIVGEIKNFVEKNDNHGGNNEP